MKVWMSLNFGQIPLLATEVVALVRLKSMNNVMTTLAPSFLIVSSSFLQITSTTIKSQLGSKFGKFKPRIAELAALERLEKNTHILIMGELL